MFRLEFEIRRIVVSPSLEPCPAAFTSPNQYFPIRFRDKTAFHSNLISHGDMEPTSDTNQSLRGVLLLQPIPRCIFLTVVTKKWIQFQLSSGFSPDYERYFVTRYSDFVCVRFQVAQHPRSRALNTPKGSNYTHWKE